MDFIKTIGAEAYRLRIVETPSGRLKPRYWKAMGEGRYGRHWRSVSDSHQNVLDMLRRSFHAELEGCGRPRNSSNVPKNGALRGVKLL
jgi:hypothetical protein